MSAPLDWHSIGYSRGMQSRTGATLNKLYPHRDRYSAQDERDFATGYYQALSDFDNDGFQTLHFYVKEKGETE